MTYDPEDPRITAYLFDELEPDEKLAFEALLENSSQLRQLVEQTRTTVESLRTGFARGQRLRLNKHHRATVRAELNTDSGDSKVTVNGTKSSSKKSRSRW